MKFPWKLGWKMSRDYVRDREGQWETRVCAKVIVNMGRNCDSISEGEENLEAVLFRKGKDNGRETLWTTEMEEKPNV